MAENKCAQCYKVLKADSSHSGTGGIGGGGSSASANAKTYCSFYVNSGAFTLTQVLCTACAPYAMKLQGCGVIVFDAADDAEICRVPLTKYVCDQAPWIVERKLQNAMDALQRLVKNYAQMYGNGTYADLTVEVQGKAFPAHRAILATRSPVFHAMFSHNLQEAGSGLLRVHDISANAMHHFLRYLYTNEIDEDNLKDNWPDLLAASHKYDVMGLKTLLEERVGAVVTVQTAIKTLQVASLYEATHLEGACLERLASQWPMIIHSPQLEELMLSEDIEDRRVGLKALKFLASRFSDS